MKSPPLSQLASEAKVEAPGRLSLLDHAAYAVVLATLITVFALAGWVHPDPAGLGTHTQLHLPPCGFYEMFHKPCPSCGMTTAFAWMMHGHPLEAVKAQPAGTAVFLAGAFLLGYLPWMWLRRRPPVEIFDKPAFLGVTLSLIVLILAVWGVRVLS